MSWRESPVALATCTRESPVPYIISFWVALTGLPHPQDPGVEVQGSLWILDTHHRLLHDKILAALVRFRQVGLVVRTR